METRDFLNLIQSKTKIKIAPDLHKTTNLMTFMIFFLTFLECKHHFRHIFDLYSKIRISNHPKILFCSLPRSGTNYFINLYTSTIALCQGKSGKPIYNPQYDTWDFEIDLRGYSTTLRNLIYAANIPKNKIKYLSSNNQINPLSIFHTHHPIQKADLVDIDSVKPLFSIRNVFDTCKSWYYHSKVEPSHWYRSENVGMDKWNSISNTLKHVIYYFNYWGEYTKNKISGEDYFYYKYEELVDDPVDILKKVFDFFDIDVDRKYLEKAAILNSYENTKRYLPKESATKTRRISTIRKPEFTDEVISHIEGMKRELLIHDFGYK